ncbi:helix-turn-helix transcriptional regulator [Erythrobacter sp.]|uniref:helix-turn-helix transcriptional regulator n=1 Tax=Erythrobacter sp. TaxID=1042 RepID=UPI001B02CC05|nr:helix-turn-helix transcriptional regulator [Erythrobacter sp.]MBO6527853.1 helix-turn-helix transcriptional regulator [Erythrobacter sp.]MBO6530280.1 helix-turn-helix transcriptional regulator [Erythrobacter sp.]
MSTEFALDLRLARRKAGYTQRDIAHLLDASQTLVSKLEQGHQQPTLEQIVSLSLIYGRSFESLFSQLMEAARFELQERILHMPDGVRSYVGTFNRDASIERLARRLADEHDACGGA